MNNLSIGDALLLLGAIEVAARVAREALQTATIVGNQPEQVLMPGAPPRPKNADIANEMRRRHFAARNELRALCGALFAESQPNPQPSPQPGPHTSNGHGSIAGRIGKFMDDPQHAADNGEQEDGA